jgi:NhaP-type Na+/H+ and K+/H+ antiporter
MHASPAVRTLRSTDAEAFHDQATLVVDIGKSAAIMVFGALVSPSFLAEAPFGAWCFGLAVVVIDRPVAMQARLVGSALPVRHRLVVSWFGPKGFASIVYGLLMLHSGIERADVMFHVVAVAVAMSIVLHSSTETLVVRRFAD